MIIDCHTHIGRNENISASVPQLLRSMDEAGIDKALVFANKIGAADNEYLLKQIAPHKDRLYGVAAAHPDEWKRMSEIQEDAKKIINWYGEGKIVACKFYTGYEHYYPSSDVIAEYLNEMEDVGCSAVFHSGDCHSSCHKKAKLKYAHPLHIDEVAVDYPNINFIIAHMGFPWVKDAAQVCYKNSNVYADMSGFVYGKFTYEDECKLHRCFNDFWDIAPSEKLLFGTDWPISDQKSYMEALWGKDGSTRIYTAEDIEKMTEQIKKVFKL